MQHVTLHCWVSGPCILRNKRSSTIFVGLLNPKIQRQHYVPSKHQDHSPDNGVSHPKDQNLSQLYLLVGILPKMLQNLFLEDWWRLQNEFSECLYQLQNCHFIIHS